ncbi:unnamed protein product [Lymnaea stagnalis]|uniref:Glycosyltransferase family 92 protein n=1 Tax=Lymnaea stagnalis TaxID=6523 RepID=A0AAV2IAQ5_LYMST
MRVGCGWCRVCGPGRSKVTGGACLLSFMVAGFWIISTLRSQGEYREWTPRSLPTRDPSVKHFIYGRDSDVYLYSAIANDPSRRGNSSATKDQPIRDQLDIVVTTLDKARVSYECCVLYGDLKRVYVTPARVYFRYYPTKYSVGAQLKEYFHPTVYVARQFSCSVPVLKGAPLPAKITLTSSSQCSSDVNDYLEVLYPPRHPGGLAVCAKIAHSGGLDPGKVIEWFEMQRLLGVDKILIYDLGNQESINTVFRYYRKLGILDVQPYELPGTPKDRSLKEGFKRTPQFVQDETMAVLECRHRMGGYSYVLSHDLDEMVIPRENISIKTLLEESLALYPNAAGFYFFTEFFILTWGPTHPDERLMVKRYRKTREPRWECYKYVYVTDRVISMLTHEIFPKDSYTTEVLPPDDVILHHYRQCPSDTWGTCSVTTRIDDVMVRYRDLDETVLKVRMATGTKS